MWLKILRSNNKKLLRGVHRLWTWMESLDLNKWTSDRTGGGVLDWIHLALDRNQWWAFANCDDEPLGSKMLGKLMASQEVLSYVQLAT
jgi:hypothetical protein